MATTASAARVVLIPSDGQRLWRWPAVLNFFLGGLGAGVYVVAALAGGLGRWSAMGPAAWLGPVLVLSGFAAVATEAGRPLRGPLVLLRLRTSWMSRELAIGGVFVALAAADALHPAAAWRGAAMVAAIMLAVAQGMMLRRARGIAAWAAPIMPALFAISAVASGAGLHLFMGAAAGRVAAPSVLAGAMIVQVASLAAWTRYLASSAAPAFARSVDSLASGRDFRAVVCGGHIAPLLLIATSVVLPALGAPALAIAGALTVWGQLHVKRCLVLRAARLSPVTLSRLSIPRRRA